MNSIRHPSHLAALPSANPELRRDTLSMPASYRWVLIVFAAAATLFASCWPAWSQQEATAPSASAATRFAIESITVENQQKFPPRIIIATSLLVEGRAYSEAELRDARYRILRLPLVLDADFELRKGSERGKYELVIQVTEARRWFFGVDYQSTVWANGISIQGVESENETFSEQSLAGYRVPVGGDGLFFVTVGGTDGTLSLGYTQYNLFSRNIIMSLKASWADCADVRIDSSSAELGEDGCATEIFDLGLDPTFSTWTLNGNNYRGRFNLSMPIGGNQSIRFLSSYRYVKNGSRRPAFDPTPESFAVWDGRQDLDTSLAWVYNTEDDSILPTRGEFLEAGLAFRWLDSDLFGFFSDSRDFVEMDSKELRLQVAAKRHWPVTAKTTLSLGLQGHFGRSQVRNLPVAVDSLSSDDQPPYVDSGLVRVSDDLTTFGASASFEHALFLKQVINGEPKHPKRRPRWREWRWENRLMLSYSGTSPDLDSPDNPLGGFRLASGVVFRNTWGVFRFELAYVDLVGR